MKEQPFGKLCQEYCGIEMPVTVCWSPAGYYLGCRLYGQPYSRESEEYYRTEQEAQDALENDTWHQRAHP